MGATSTSSVPAPTSITFPPQSGRSPRAASSTRRTRPIRPRQVRALCNCCTNTRRMIASLTGLDVSQCQPLRRCFGAGRGGADGGPAAQVFAPRVLLPDHGASRSTATSCAALCPTSRSSWSSCPIAPRRGTILPRIACPHCSGRDLAALVIPQPNFFGGLEAVHALTDWAHRAERSGHSGGSIPSRCLC